MLLTRVKPHIYLPGLALFWGTVAACMGATHNWQQVAGLRFVLGIAEAGFAPGVAFYLSSWFVSRHVTLITTSIHSRHL